TSRCSSTPSSESGGRRVRPNPARDATMALMYHTSVARSVYDWFNRRRDAPHPEADVPISRETLASLLAFREPRMAPISVEVGARDGYVFERISLDLEGVGAVRAFLTRPPGTGRHPAILYGHS